MARIRTIKPDFWKSESIAALPFRTRLTFIGLWTYVDDNGVGLDNFKLIAAELFGLEDDPREARANVREDLARLHSAGRIVRYTVAGKRYFAVTNWTEHQKIDKPGKPRYPDFDDTSAIHLSREEAWSLDSPTAAPVQDSRDPRETLAPGTGNREEGTGKKEEGTPPKADTANAMSSAHGELHGLPTANKPATPEAQVRQAVAAFVEGATEAGLDKPSGALCGRVGNRAKALIKEGKDFTKLIDAARALGASEYTDLDTAYRKVDARSKGISRDDGQSRGSGELARRDSPPAQRRSTGAVRAEQALSVADELDRKFGHGRYAQNGATT